MDQLFPVNNSGEDLGNAQSTTAIVNSTLELPTTSWASARPTVSAEIVATVGVVILGIGSCANSVVLTVLIRARRHFGSSVHTLIANQSAMDLFGCVFGMVTLLMMVGYKYKSDGILDNAICVLLDGTSNHEIVSIRDSTRDVVSVLNVSVSRSCGHPWILLDHNVDYNGCQILDNVICVAFEGLALTALGVTAGKIGLAVITLERYFKIVHAIAHRKYYRNWMTKVGVALPWIGGAGVILFPTIGTTRIVNGRCLRPVSYTHLTLPTIYSV